MTLQERIAAYVPYNEQEENDKRLMLRYLSQFDDLLHRENEMAHMTASAWVVSPDRTQVLLAYHNVYDSWSWLGGHADGEEDLLAVAIREVREESGVRHLRPVSEDIYSLEILPVDAHHKRGKFVSPHLHLNLTFLLEADPADAVRVKEDENSAVSWFKADEVFRVVKEARMMPIYRKLTEKLPLK